MTDKDFDNLTFCKDDKIEIRQFFKTELIDVEYVDFANRTINGYTPQQITAYHRKTKKR